MFAKFYFRYFPFALLVVAPAILTACTALVGSSSSGESPGSPVIIEETTEPVLWDAELRPVVVDDVSVEIGVGSPIPVEVVVSGSWPDLCAQLAQVNQAIDGSRIEISLMATPADPSCPPDFLGVPFRIAIPLNMVEVSLGSFVVTVNSVESSFEWTGTSPQALDDNNLPAMTVAFIGLDGNIWVLDTLEGEPKQVTADATTPDADWQQLDEVVNYYFPKLSSDGTMVAYRRDSGMPIESGMQFTFGLWVYDLATGIRHQVYDSNPAGLDWKPGTHLLVFGQGISDNYFTVRGEIDSSLAKGISVVDLDTGMISELVGPERGYALYSPHWSPDGRFLGFEEVNNYEGSGLFAYFDFEAQDYVAWEEAIGLYDWSPDGSQITYDRMTYAASGDERIFLQDRLDRNEQQLSPDYSEGYAFSPVFSPLGDRVVYFTNTGGSDSSSYALTVQSLEAEDLMPIELGQFEAVQSLHWSPDGSHLVFSAGPYDAQQVVAVNAADGGFTILAEGSSPDVTWE